MQPLKVFQFQEFVLMADFLLCDDVVTFTASASRNLTTMKHDKAPACQIQGAAHQTFVDSQQDVIEAQRPSTIGGNAWQIS